VSHVPWPEEKHESATKETICWPLTAAAIEFAAWRAAGFSQREKKLWYMALAQAELQAGDRIAAENYYQHAEHYFRMSSDRGAT
jgi:uncharacterized protein DUF4167